MGQNLVDVEQLDHRYELNDIRETNGSDREDTIIEIEIKNPDEGYIYNGQTIMHEGKRV